MKSAYTAALFAATLAIAIRMESEIDLDLGNTLAEPFQIQENLDGSFSIYSPVCDKTVFKGHTDYYFEASVTDGGDVIVKNGCVNVQRWNSITDASQCDHLVDINEKTVDKCKVNSNSACGSNGCYSEYDIWKESCDWKYVYGTQEDEEAVNLDQGVRVYDR